MSNETVESIREAVTSGERSAVEVAETALARIERAERLNAFLAVDREVVLDQARRVDESIGDGRPAGPLAGVPIAVKDNICTADYPTTCASRMLEGFRSIYDAEVVERLRAAGAIVVGKTNLDEFAMGSSNENSAAGPVLNPWSPEHVAGGSSGGSAAAVASGVVPAALGSDTGGSIRQPASFCGVVGLKPTYGRVSRRGLVAFASSLDQIGPFGATVADAARIYVAIAGHDPGDSTSSTEPVESVLGSLDRPIDGMRVGVLPDEAYEGVAPAVGDALEATRKMLEELGASTVTVELPRARFAVATYYVLATAEASSNLARYDGVRYGFRDEGATNLEELYERTRTLGFGSEVLRRIMLGTFVLSAGYVEAYYRRAQKARALIADDYRVAFERCDAVLTPTSPVPAFALGSRIDDPLSMYLADVFTIPANLAGIPAINVPVAVSQDNLPIGMQLAGDVRSERALLQLAAALEGARGDVGRPEVLAGPTQG